MAHSSQVSEALTSRPNGWDGRTSSTSSATRSVGKSSPITSPNPNPSTMSKPSTQLRFEDVYESFRVASPVSLFQQQESGPEHPTIDICGRRCLESFERLAPPTSWRRTFAASLVGMKGWFSTRCALTWKVKATKSSRSYFLLQASTRRTAATEFGLLRTPSAQEPGIRAERLVTKDGQPARIGERAYDKHTGRLCQVGLQQQVQMGLLLTPTTREEPVDLDKFKARMEKYPNGTTMPNLATQIQQMLPTPTARCWNTGTEKERPADQPTRRSELNHLMAQEAGKPSQLSPRFVEEMMGFPKGWTVSPFQSGDGSQ